MARKICMVAYTEYDFDARVRREAEMLVDAGYTVICLTPQNSPQQCRVRGVLVRGLNEKKYTGKSNLRYMISYLRFLSKSFLECCRLLVRSQLHAVHVHNMPNFLVYAGLIPWIFGKKIILDLHDNVPETYKSKFPASKKLLFRFLCFEERLACLLAHTVICVNHPQRDLLVNRGLPIEKTLVSMNVPDFKLFNGNLKREESSDTFNIVSHGTMAIRLGVDRIIEAAVILRDRIPGVRVHLWGVGDDTEFFMQLTRSLDLEEVVSFKPKGVPLPELPRKLLKMNIGVLGNTKRDAVRLALPVKLLEYVALGIPVVAPRLEPIEHYFSDEMVTYYEPDDVSSLANGVFRLYQDRQRGKVQAQKALAFLNKYGWEKQHKGLLNLYQDVLGYE
jgi:glycosyltransferase involved in cell wall biosynthesis